jgi:hypothetical protein
VRRRSPAFEAFRFSFFAEDASAPEPLDLNALRRLSPRERLFAERLLLEALPDRRAIVGLGELGSHRAQARLATLFERERSAAEAAGAEWRAHDLVAAAKALWLIAPHPTYAHAVIGVLANGRCFGERMDAAAALGDMPTAETEDALNAALEDRDALVRHHAARSLLAMHGLETDARALAPMIARVMAEDPERRTRGRRELAAAMDRSSAPGSGALSLHREDEG